MVQAPPTTASLCWFYYSESSFSHSSDLLEAPLPSCLQDADLPVGSIMTTCD